MGERVGRGGGLHQCVGVCGGRGVASACGCVDGAFVCVLLCVCGEGVPVYVCAFVFVQHRHRDAKYNRKTGVTTTVS